MMAKVLKIMPMIFIMLFAMVSVAHAQSQGVQINIPLGGQGKDQLATPVKMILLITLLSLAPSILISVTSFTRIVVVFSFLRQAMGLQSSPPNQVLIGLALFLTVAIMSPVFKQSYDAGISPYLEGKMEEKAAFDASIEPLRKFMFSQTRSSDLQLMVDISRSGPIDKFENLPTASLIPAFILSELKTSFQIGFMIYIPFVVIDMVVAMILLAMGMMVLPPVVISLPFKIMLFVVVDGWGLVMASLVKSFR